MTLLDFKVADSRDWKNGTEGEAVRHVDILDEQEGLGVQQRMPSGIGKGHQHHRSPVPNT